MSKVKGSLVIVFSLFLTHAQAFVVQAEEYAGEDLLAVAYHINLRVWKKMFGTARQTAE